MSNMAEMMNGGGMMEAMQGVQAVGAALGRIVELLEADVERTDALILATHRQTKALEAMDQKLEFAAEMFGGNKGKVLSAVLGAKKSG